MASDGVISILCLPDGILDGMLAMLGWWWQRRFLQTLCSVGCAPSQKALIGYQLQCHLHLYTMSSNVSIISNKHISGLQNVITQTASLQRMASPAAQHRGHMFHAWNKCYLLSPVTLWVMLTMHGRRLASQTPFG